MLELSNESKTALLLLVGAAVFELGREMREASPELSEMRKASEHERADYLQHLVDGQAQTAIIVAGAALVATWATGSFTPGLILLGTFGALAYYQHSVLNAPSY
jgi:hypothetical protein